MIDIIRQWNPKARIPHQCALCHRMIGVGETYERQTVKTDSDLSLRTFKSCLHCITMTNLCDFWDADEGFSFYSFIEFEPQSVWELRLKAMWRRGWTRKDGALYPVPVYP